MNSAQLVLEDGSIFSGISIGAEGLSVGEVVFNTALTGYQEILSDPSYAQQIVTLTYPHIGNVGTTSEDDESRGVFASGLVIRDLPLLTSNWRSEKTLQQYLLDNNVVAIADLSFSGCSRHRRRMGRGRFPIVGDLAVALATMDGSCATNRCEPRHYVGWTCDFCARGLSPTIRFSCWNPARIVGSMDSPRRT